MSSADLIRSIFRKTSEIQEELRRLDHDMYMKFKAQNAGISDLEHYNLRKIIQDDQFEAVDTLEMRKSLIDSWVEKIDEIKVETSTKM